MIRTLILSLGLVLLYSGAARAGEEAEEIQFEGVSIVFGFPEKFSCKTSVTGEIKEISPDGKPGIITLVGKVEGTAEPMPSLQDNGDPEKYVGEWITLSSFRANTGKRSLGRGISLLGTTKSFSAWSDTVLRVKDTAAVLTISINEPGYTRAVVSLHQDEVNYADAFASQGDLVLQGFQMNPTNCQLYQ